MSFTVCPFKWLSKDEFSIEPQYAHKKNLDKSEKNHMEGQNWLMKTILQLKSIKKPENFQISMLYDDPFPRHDFFLWFV